MMSLFSRGSSPPPGASNMQAQASHSTQQAPPVAQNVPAVVDAYAPETIIHSPLPSRPSPVQSSGNTLDELLKEFSTTSPHLEPDHPPSPPPFSNITQQSPPTSNQHSSQQAPPPQDLLAILTNAAQNASPASNSSSQPPISQKTQQPGQSSTMNAQESNNAGRMLLDSLLSSTAPQPQPPRPVDTERSYQGQGIDQGQQQQPAQQQQPLRKTAFDFVSPMDAFQSNPSSSPASSIPKRKTAASEGSEGHPVSFGNQPATRQITSTSPLGAATVTSETAATSNPTGDSASGAAPGEGTKRKSIDLLEQLTRAVPLHQPIAPPLDQSQPSSMFPGSGVSHPQLSAQAPGGYRRAGSPVPLFPRDQSPALMGQTPPSTSPPVHAFPGSVATAQASIPARASPTFRGRANNGNAGKKGDWKSKNNFTTKSPAGPQSFTLDLSLPLAATSASSERLHITPIALLKLESIYVPGCTIGVSHWIAYAMTKGRVRLIARANGARALLKLPATFSANSSIVDLVTSGNRLAGVTSDGGFVVWEVPPMVDDDIPSLLLVSVPPTPNNPYKSIKWHPSNPDVLSLATQNEIHLINVQNLYHIHGGDSISQNVLVGDAEVFSPSSNPSAGGGMQQQQAIAAFAFDPSHSSLATISVEGVLNIWAVGSQQQTNYMQPYQQHQPLLWSGKVLGEGQPSSLFFMDQQQGVIVGRKRNTIIQLVPNRSTNVQATVRFVQGNGVFGSTNSNANNQASVADDREFFAHLAYDPRIRCVWAASSHRPSLMALRVVPPDEGSKVGGESPLHFEQILDFPILHPTISLGILVTSDGNEVEEMERGSGMDANGSAGPGGAGQEMSMALVAYVIHAGGVDQVLIGKQDLEQASQNALVKLPPVQNTQPNTIRQDSPSLFPTGSPANVNPGTPNHPSGPRELKKSLPSNPPAYVPPPMNEPPPAFPSAPIASLTAGGRNFGPMDTASPQRPRSPASDPDGAELLENVADTRIHEGGKRGGRRGRDRKQQQGAGTDRSTDSAKPVSGFGAAEAAATGLIAESSGSIIREIQKVEDGIQSKITSAVTREFRDQTRLLEQMHDEDRFKAAEFQDRLVKTLSGELVKNTGRVFEAALKTEVQRTILPALEMITKNEVRQAIDAQIVRGLGESMKQTLPNEIERLLLRPDVSNHVARTFSSAVTPLIERHVKESINHTLIPSYHDSTTKMYDQLYQEINEEILNLKKEIITWQSDALKGQESLLREMELSIRLLSDQIKALSGQRSITPYNMQSHRSSPAPIPPHLRQQSQPYQPLDKMTNMGTWQMGPTAVKQDTPTSQGHPNMPPPHQGSLPVPQTIYQPPQQPPSHALQNPIQAMPQPQYRHETPTEDWEKVFLQALSAPDIRALREVLLNCPADKVMPLNGPLLVTQTIVLSVIHKLAGYLLEVESIDESISLLWWLTRTSQVLDAHDRIIHDYLDRMLPNIQENLFRAIPRVTTAGPQYSRQLSDLIQTLIIKAHQ